MLEKLLLGGGGGGWESSGVATHSCTYREM